MKAMILAAGRGQRMRPLTDSVPKPLLPVNNKPLIEYHLEKLSQAGVTDVVINYAWLGEQFPKVLGDGSRWGVSIHYSPETAGGLETAGGIINALPLLGDAPFWLINGDVWTDLDFNRLPTSLDDDVANLMLVANPEYNAKGDFGVQNGRVKVADGNLPSYTYSGIGLYSPHWFVGRPIEKLPLRPMFDKAIQQQRLAATVVSDAQWTDVGTPERLAQLDQQLRGTL